MNGRFNPIRPSSTRHITAAAVIGLEQEAIGKIESRFRVGVVSSWRRTPKASCSTITPRRATSTTRLGVSPFSTQPAASFLNAIHALGIHADLLRRALLQDQAGHRLPPSREAERPRRAAPGTARAPRPAANVFADRHQQVSRRRPFAPPPFDRRARPAPLPARRATAIRATASQAASRQRGRRRPPHERRRSGQAPAGRAIFISSTSQ